MTFDDAHRLIKKGDIAGIRRAIDGGLDVNLLNRFSWSLLMLAASEGNVGLGRLLISRGASIEQTNDAGETALSLAAQQGHSRFVQLLLRAGASTMCRPHGHSIHEWVTIASALPTGKIQAILDLLHKPFGPH